MNILYVPGLGEGAVLSFQKKYSALLNVFRSKHSKIAVFEPRWESDENFEKKYKRLLELYETIHPTIVVGPSAGGALTITLFAEHEELKTAYVICGKLRGSEKIGEVYNKRAPALIDAVKRSELHLKSGIGRDIRSFVSKHEYDGIVEKEDMFTEEMRLTTMPVVQHGRAILYWLFRYLPGV